MRIELYRKLVGTDYLTTCCAVCGNDFRRGNVYPVASGDRGGELGEMCEVCLDYLNRRKNDESDPTLGNWPAREWPTVEDLKEARVRYPEPMFPDEGSLAEAAEDFTEEDRIIQSSIIWPMEVEKLTRSDWP